jgi:hypothetical protein
MDGQRVMLVAMAAGRYTVAVMRVTAWLLGQAISVVLSLIIAALNATPEAVEAIVYLIQGTCQIAWTLIVAAFMTLLVAVMLAVVWFVVSLL